MQVLFATTLHPGARGSGGERVSATFVDALENAGHRVSVLSYRRAGPRPPFSPTDVDVGPRAIETRRAGAWPLLWMARALATGAPYSAKKYDSRAYRHAFKHALVVLEPELIVIDHAQLSFLTGHLPAGVRTVLLAHNVEHRLYAEQARGPGLRARVNGREARRILMSEQTWCARADAVWTLTATDRNALTALGANARTFAVPPDHVVREAAPPTHDLALLGTWTWAANAAGLAWWTDEVLPLLPPGLRIRVGGAGATAIPASPNLERVEWVEDAAAFLRSARVVVVPAVAGAGLQVKTLDAIASGRAVVATPLALRGIEDPPASVRVAAGAAAFADAIRSSLGESGGSAEAEAWVKRRWARFATELATATGQPAR